MSPHSIFSKWSLAVAGVTKAPCRFANAGMVAADHKLYAEKNVTQRRMLRWMVKTRRHDDEAWPDYISRATHHAEDLAFQHGFKDWVDVQCRRKGKLAAKTWLSADGRWAKRLMHWIPFFRCLPRRSVGHPVRRWSDVL